MINLMRIKKFINLNVVALIFNFSGALMMYFATGELDSKGGLGVFDSGGIALYLNHPTMLKFGFRLILIGFLFN